MRGLARARTGGTIREAFPLERGCGLSNIAPKERASSTRAPRARPGRVAREAAATDAAVRRRLARLKLDLHDGPMQDLAGIGLALAALRRELEALPGETSSAVAQVNVIGDALGKIEYALRSLIVDDVAVEPASVADIVHEEVARFEQLSTARVELDLVDTIQPDTDSQRIVLQRVLREALTNAARHAQPTRVRVELFEVAGGFCLRIRDDGKGCGDAHANGHDHRGLAGMRERLELIGGDLEFDSRPGGPTTVTAVLKRWHPSKIDDGSAQSCA
jgi:signal transduction histidine kinase